MLSLATVLLLSMLGSPPDKTQDDIEKRYRDLKEEVLRDGEAMATPWRTFQRFAPEFLDLAQEAPDDPSALAAILTVVEYGAQLIDTFHHEGKSHLPLMGRALDSLAGHRLDEDRVGRVCLTLSRIPSPIRESFLRRAARDATNPSVRGRACLALAELLAIKLRWVESFPRPMPAELRRKTEESFGKDYLEHLLECDGARLRAEAESLLERVIEEFSGIAFVRGTAETPVWAATAEKDQAAGKTLGMIAEADLYELRSLKEGSIAPEIEGQDAEKAPFKLSDHRGKVVLLTFSGNWCGPCRSMYPHERELVTRFQGRPFALLSVNTDEKLDTLKESIRAGEVTWRCWWDGPPGGPIATRWNVRAWPTIYVLDARGVIRAKNPPDESLGQLINALLEEIPDGAKPNRDK